MKSRSKTKSYETIMQTAKTLFWKFGFHKVSIEEICREAGVSKMTFYRTFSNKNEIAKTVLGTVLENGLQAYREIMARDIPFSEKIKFLIQLKFTHSSDISEEFIKDVYLYDKTGLKQQLEEYRKLTLTEFMNDIKLAQSQGWVREDIKPEFILYILNTLNEKITDEQLLNIYSDPQALIMDITKFFFYGILNQTNS